MKHTPAPWRLDPYGDGMAPHRIYADHGLVSHKGKKYPMYSIICDADGSMPEDVTIANARLIAAAPELLEALETILRLAEAGVIHRNETGKPQWSLTDELQTIARAAIQKAEG